jgi:RNA polymerase sigma-70 factor (ECF subfamily)
MEPIGILFNRYLELMYGVCLKYLKSPEDSEDAVMQIFELISEKLKSHDVQNFKSWLHVVVKNYCFETLRKRKKKLTLVHDENIMHSEALLHHDDEFEVEIHAEKDDLVDCMSKLPTKQNQAVNLFYIQGKSYKEIADMTGQSTNKVRSFIQNGRRNLKICMEKKNGTKPE